MVRFRVLYITEALPRGLGRAAAHQSLHIYHHISVRKSFTIIAYGLTDSSECD